MPKNSSHFQESFVFSKYVCINSVTSFMKKTWFWILNLKICSNCSFVHEVRTSSIFIWRLNFKAWHGGLHVCCQILNQQLLNRDFERVELHKWYQFLYRMWKIFFNPKYILYSRKMYIYTLTYFYKNVLYTLPRCVKISIFRSRCK